MLWPCGGAARELMYMLDWGVRPRVGRIDLSLKPRLPLLGPLLELPGHQAHHTRETALYIKASGS
jgi:hypothetical protein